MKSSHLAAIDLGTNSFHLIVVETFENGRFEVVTTQKESVRLGSGGGDMGEIAPDAQERGLNALGRFKAIADSYKANIRAVATSALREAPNQKEFLDTVRRGLGIEIQVIEGAEEARLIYLGILQALPSRDKQILAVDIGGGSTEFVIGKMGEPDLAVSLKLGAIRLTSRFFPEGRPTPKSVKECRRFIRIMLSGVAAKAKRLGFELAVGSSGTANTLWEMIAAEKGREPENGLGEPVIHLAKLEGITEKILSYPSAQERLKLSGLDEKRADIIVGGAILLEEIFHELKIKEMYVSPYALREGVVVDYLARQSRRVEFAPDIRKRSVEHLAKRILGPKSTQFASARHMSILAGRLFDQLLTARLLPDWMGLDESLLLEFAAMLHNTGLSIAHSAHHKHSYYIIKNSDKLLGFTRLEIEVLAQICRYHRKKNPTTKHEPFRELSGRAQEQVCWLTGILRVAIGLDRRHERRVEDIRLSITKESIEIQVLPANSRIRQKPRDIRLELWAARNNKDLLCECLGRDVFIEHSGKKKKG